MNFKNCELFGTPSTKLPKDTEIFSLPWKTSSMYKSRQKNIGNPHVIFTQILQPSIHRQSYVILISTHFLPSYYFKAHPNHYFISSSSISVVCLKGHFKKKHNYNSFLKHIYNTPFIYNSELLQHSSYYKGLHENTIACCQRNSIKQLDIQIK